MKRVILLMVLFLGTYYSSSAKLLGGNANGQSPTQEVKPGEINSGGISGEVNLFTGTFNSSYPLGTVSTPSGLSYGISLSYNSSFAAGDNLPQSSGIPYGEGWNLDIPTLSISTEDYNRFTLQQLDDMDFSINSLYNCDNGSTGVYTSDCTGTTPTPIYNGDGTCAAAREEGRVYWFAPMLNIPGVASGRLVYKEKDGNDYVFVPHKFESYVEARLRKEGDNDQEHWVIITDDGTQYEMRAKTVSHRNATNQRVQSSCTDDEEALVNLLLPKTEILTWHCERISHPNKTGTINFTYQKLGAFDMFPIIRQYGSDTPINSEISRQFFPNDDKKHLDVAYQEILLTEVNSGYEKLVLDYDNILKSHLQPELLDEGSRLLDPATTSQKTDDPLYNYESVKTWTSGSDFNGWHRYLHLKSDFTSNYDISSTNPYQGTVENLGFLGSRLEREEITNSPTKIPFSYHDNNDYFTGYLESPRVGAIGTDIEMIAGDMYELKVILNSTS